MVDEGLIERRDAVARMPADQIDQLLHPVIDGAVRATPLCRGLPASPGAASGVAVFDPDVAERRAGAGEAVVLVREETTPEDFHGIVAARAIVTARGGMTSHAAVVARGMGKCAVVGCQDLHVDAQHRRFTVNGTTVREGDWMTVDGATGAVYSGALPTVPSEVMRVVTGVAPPGRRSAVRIVRACPRLGGRIPQAAGSRQCRHSPRRPHRARVRCGRHRIVPHRAHVLRRRSHRRHARDDRGPRRGRAAPRTREAPARCSARISRAFSRRWPAIP